MLRRVALVRTDVSEELSTFFIRVTRIGELGTTLAVTSHKVVIITAYCLIICSQYSPLHKIYMGQSDFEREEIMSLLCKLTKGQELWEGSL
jgi:hypothetical protein